MVSALAAACLAAAGCSCGAPVTPLDAPPDAPPDPIDTPTTCQGVLPDEWALLEWATSDGARGSTGCGGPSLLFGDTSASGQFTQAVLLGLVSSDVARFMLPSPLPAPLDCSQWLGALTNIDWVTGATGDVVGHRYPLNRGEPTAYVEIWSSGPGVANCTGDTTARALTPRSGRWEITQGGTFGEVIEVHVYDVEFELHDGRIFTITHGAWRGTVLGPRVLP